MLRRPGLSLTALIAAIGIGLTAYYGEAWWKLPVYTEADIEASTELNLALDLERRGPHLQPDAENLERLREQVRAEVEADIRQQRETVQLRFGIGLMCLVVALGQALSAYLLGRGAR